MSAFSTHIEIAGRRIGSGYPCYVIAEAGVNHFGSLETAYQLVDLAAEAKADAFKLQHYKTDVLVGPSAPDWRERLRTKELRDEQVLAIKQRCDKAGITFLCTGHDETAVEFLDKTVGVPAFKVGSGEIHNWPSLHLLARRGKPIILSTGMYSFEDIRQAVATIMEGGCRELAVLHCITHYPAEPGEINLAVMKQIREIFPGPVGYSDHTAGTAVPLAAVALGASVIEKHITIHRNVPNAQDWKVSCGPEDFPKFVSDVREIDAARGGGPKIVGAAEQQAMLWARKSLTAAVDIAAGTALTAGLVVAQRPGSGLPPLRLPELIGRRLRHSVAAGTLLKPEMFE